MEAVLFFLCLLTSVLIVWLFLWHAKPGFALGFGVFSLLLAYLTGHFWVQLLGRWGEPGAYLGFGTRPWAPILLGLLVLADLAGMALGARMLAKQKKNGE